MRRLFRQFSTPGGVPSHVSVPTPGSIHEGGELGYALVHAFGAAFDNPDLVVACVVGDGEAETGPLAGSWKGIDFLNPARDGAVLPILHLNGYKISGPTVLGRATDDDIASCSRATATTCFVEGDDPPVVHRELRVDARPCFDAIEAIQADARARGSPHGRAGRDRVAHAEGLDRTQGRRRPAGRGNVPGPPGAAGEGARQPRASPSLEEWMRSYRPEELFDGGGRWRLRWRARARRATAAWAPTRTRTAALLLKPLDLPDFTEYTVPVATPGAELHESTRRLGEMLRDVFTRNETDANFRLFCPDETNSNRLGAVFEVENRVLLEPIVDIDDHVAPDGRVMEVLSEHNCEGWLEGYLLTGRHGLFATYEAFAMVSASMTVQHAKWLEAARDLTWRALGRIAERAAHLDVLAERPQRVQPPGPGIHRHGPQQEGHGAAHLPAARRQQPALGRRPLPSQPRLREPHRHRQAAPTPVARHGRRPPARRARRVGVGLGGERAPEGARSGARLGGRHRRPWRRSRRPTPAPALPRVRVPRRERRRPHGAVPRGASPARDGRGRVRGRCSPPTRTSSSPSTGTRVPSTI